ncbi:MAG: hypothetical protein FJW88_05330 [Actinobacteria bacterium]|nr:hypothetical protein [Actinomycetota bacterium]
MDRRTVDVYETRAAEWATRKSPGALDPAAGFAARCAPGALRADLGCGPGWHGPALGAPLLALDAAGAMLDLVVDHAPGALRVQATVDALPLRRASLHGAWANKVYMHLAMAALPRALADLHGALVVGAPLHLRVTSDRIGPAPDTEFPGRHFEYWSAARLADVLIGAGFSIEGLRDDGEEWLDAECVRERMLPDVVGPGMRLLVCGLNPSLYAADVGIGFARPGNRFWPAALGAGILTVDRDPAHALRVNRVGMTDLVKRATARADELLGYEYAEGAARLTRLVEWLRPAALCFVGLAGYREVVDRRARPGVQPAPFAGVPTYVMPNTSGLNARTPLGELTEHLRAAAALGA